MDNLVGMWTVYAHGRAAKGRKSALIDVLKRYPKWEGIPRSTVSAIENDRVQLGVERAEVLARALPCRSAVRVFPGSNVEKEPAA